MSRETAPRVIPPPRDLAQVGPLVVVDGDCAYFSDGRSSTTAFALPGHLSGADYQAAMDLGMRRSGTVVYRPLCDSCRRCQPLRIPVDAFVMSKSQRRVFRKNEERFRIDIGRPTLDDERLKLYSRYQRDQHGDNAQDADEKSYRRFLIDTVTDTVELTWREDDGRIIGVGIVDVTPDALSSVYFYWDPDYRKYSLGVHSAITEIALAKSWDKKFYYLGYLVAGAPTMTYKADFHGAEIWDGIKFVPLPVRGIVDDSVKSILHDAEQSAISKDNWRFRLAAARPLPVVNDS